MGHARRGGGTLILRLAFGLFVLLFVWMTWHNMSRMFGSGKDDSAAEAIRQFYTYEQSGDFGSSWELFHPLMQQRFDKSAYIQNRAHILMQDFGAGTFSFSLGKEQRLTDWRQSADAPPIGVVYRVVVTMLFQTPYGNFEMVQPCFAAYDSGAWKILWSYNDTSLSDFPGS